MTNFAVNFAVIFISFIQLSSFEPCYFFEFSHLICYIKTKKGAEEAITTAKNWK